jgi:hypothetical protein
MGRRTKVNGVRCNICVYILTETYPSIRMQVFYPSLCRRLFLVSGEDKKRTYERKEKNIALEAIGFNDIYQNKYQHKSDKENCVLFFFFFTVVI